MKIPMAMGESLVYGNSQADSIAQVRRLAFELVATWRHRPTFIQLNSRNGFSL